MVELTGGIGCPEPQIYGPNRLFIKDSRLNTDDNTYVEFHAPRDMHVRYGPQLIAAFIRRFPTPVESVLMKPSALLGEADRLEARIEGLARQGRDTDEYAARLVTLR